MPAVPNQQKQAKRRPIVGRLTEWIITFGLGMTISAYLFYFLPNLHDSAPNNDDHPLASHHPPLDRNVMNSNDDYDAAILKLRCFTSPGCFPSIKCRKGSPQKIKRKQAFEEQSFCAEDLRLQSQKNPEKCLVYSFGIYVSYEWEAKVASIFGCEVHAFDPTVTHPDNPAPGVTFHQLGLQGKNTNMSATHGEGYRPIEDDRLLSLEDIRSKLGHQNRSIDVLMLDCEGCEWGALRQLICEGSASHHVKQIMTEFHFQKNLGLHDEKHVMIAAEAISCLEKDRWGITSIEKEGAGWSDLEYMRGVSSVVDTFSFLMLVSLRRVPPDEKLPYEVIDDHANAARKEELKMVEYQKKIGKNRTEWPDDFHELNRRRKELTQEAKSVVQQRKNFDSNGYVKE